MEMWRWNKASNLRFRARCPGSGACVEERDPEEEPATSAKTPLASAIEVRHREALCRNGSCRCGLEERGSPGQQRWGSAAPAGQCGS
eukprot:1605607-Rhodomonas_salina.6